ncbi:MAG: carboxylesterase family protein [Myxococcales bacterium]
METSRAPRATRIPLQLGGDSAPLFYDGQFFAGRQGVVLVSFNYRLGPFGFFAHDALAKEGSPLGNQGLLDQSAVLKWVQENIAAFGGDPGNVTIFGESAGSADVCYHVVSPRDAGLFQRAISESGGCTAGPTGERDLTAQEVAGSMQAYAAALGCSAGDVLPCLRSKSVSELLAQGMQPDPSGGYFNRPAWRFGVVVDGEGGFLPSSAADAFANGQINHVPYLLGTNSDEGTLFVLGSTASNQEEYLDALRMGYGERAETIAALYPASKFGGDYKAALARVVGDAGLGCGTHDSARRAAKAGLPVFMYNFNIPWTVAFGALGAAHASEISHVFGAPYSANQASTQVSDAMNSYWAQFARTGDPNYPGAPAVWPRFEPDANDDDLRLQLDPGFELLQSFRKDECAFWRGIYASVN